MDFLYSPGFGGACALLAAIIAFVAAGLSTRQRRHADEAALAEAARQREDLRRTEAIQQCWDRYVWVVDHANDIGLRLTTGLLSRITDTAAQLGDLDLVEFSRQFTLELLAATAGEQPSTNRARADDNGDEETEANPNDERGTARLRELPQRRGPGEGHDPAGAPGREAEQDPG